MNYIEDIPFKVEKSIIDGVPEGNIYNAVIEISNGDNVKYEVHPSGRYLSAVRTLNPIFKYPFSYGFIPQTLAEDGDGLDIIIITPEPLAHLAVIEVRLLGVVETCDRGVVDNKIIAVPAYSTLKRISIDKVMAFLKTYKYPNNDSTLVGDFVASPAKAEEFILKAHEAFKKIKELAKPMVEAVVSTVTPVTEEPKQTPVKEVIKEEAIKESIKEDILPKKVEEKTIPECLKGDRTLSDKPLTCGCVEQKSVEEVGEDRPEPFLEKIVEETKEPESEKKVDWLT